MGEIEIQILLRNGGIKVKDVKIENICGSLRISVDGTVIGNVSDEMGKVVTENLLINLDQVGAINLTIEN
ncbi:hypothetical protein CN587_25275 [Bacillus wiedmannii]|nr:hypothetical protein CN587_25275 [Bacillus wiedmannii]